MPIELLGETYLSESEFAERLGCTVAALQKMRARGDIGYQRLPGRRGAFYGNQHIAECLAALAVPACRESAVDAPLMMSKPDPSAKLSDMRRAIEILSRRKGGSQTSS